MSKTIRISTTPNGGDKYIKIKLTQSFDFLEILSLKLAQTDIYRKFAADYGVIVGRVIANRGFGVPNAKVSIFIPLDENETDSEIIGRYPFTSVTDTDSNGVRYNLLEDVQQNTCHKPVGTFPNKRKVLDNDVWLEIYNKYYKYTTTTNEAGDFMIFGVPLGNQKIHMDVDVSNIGFVSLKPYELINQGYTANLFESNTTYKDGTDLDSLVQIQKRDFNVNVLPFWGDLDENEIGINRVDFNLGVDLTPTALFFGSIFSSDKDNGVYKLCVPKILNGGNCQMTTGVGDVEIIRRISNNSNEVEFIQSNATKIDEYGNWAISIPMNLDTVVTDEFGNLIPSEDPTVGIPTRARVRCRMSLRESIFGFKERTAHYLVPNMYNRYAFGSDTLDEDMVDLKWKKAYTVTNYIPRYQLVDPLTEPFPDESPFYTGIKFIGTCEGKNAFPYNRVDANVNPLYNILCVIITAVGAIIDIINDILKFIVFEVVLVFVCTIQYLLDPDERGACRCNACLDLNTNQSPTPIVPTTWTGIPPDGVDDYPSPTGNGIDDRLECAACFEQNGTYSIKISTELVASITTNLAADGVDGTYNGIFQTSTSGNGHSASFDIIVSGGVVTSIIAVDGGEQYSAGDTLTFDKANFGATANDLVLTLALADLQTIIIIDGNMIDCSSFDNSYCADLCYQCDISIIPLNCDGVDYLSGNEWADCVKQNLAEDLNVVTYEFYNDWIIGSLYALLFEYDRTTSIERFCGYDCRIFGTFPPLDDELRENVCVPSRIVDKSDFTSGSPIRRNIYTNLIPADGGGLIEKNNGLLYYTARNDIAKNNDPLTSGLTVSEKEKLLFATNIIEMGSVVTCDLEGKPFLIDRLESSTYQRSEGNETLFDVTNCGFPLLGGVNRNGIQLISQAGVDIIVDEATRTGSVITSSDNDTFTLVGSQSFLPDDDGQNSIIILNRSDVILRQYLCENFPYYGFNGVYTTQNYPIVGGKLVTQDITNNTVDVETVTDECIGYDDFALPADKMPPYYMYFGMNKGNTALDKLKKLYFDNCIS